VICASALADADNSSSVSDAAPGTAGKQVFAREQEIKALERLQVLQLFKEEGLVDIGSTRRAVEPRLPVIRDEHPPAARGAVRVIPGLLNGGERAPHGDVELLFRALQLDGCDHGPGGPRCEEPQRAVRRLASGAHRLLRRELPPAGPRRGHRPVAEGPAEHIGEEFAVQADLLAGGQLPRSEREDPLLQDGVTLGQIRREGVALDPLVEQAGMKERAAGVPEAHGAQ
jgi:hypothetical protein